MKRKNPVAKELRTAKYRQRVVPDIKKYKRKQKHKKMLEEFDYEW